MSAPCGRTCTRGIRTPISSDNWIYCASGGHYPGHGVGNAVEFLKRGERIKLGSRDLRIRPEAAFSSRSPARRSSAACETTVGPLIRRSKQSPLWHYVLEDRYATRHPHVPAPDPREQLRVPPNPRIDSAKEHQKRFHNFEQSGRFTSACGIWIHRDVTLFERSDFYIAARSATQSAETENSSDQIFAPSRTAFPQASWRRFSCQTAPSSRASWATVLSSKTATLSAASSSGRAEGVLMNRYPYSSMASL